MIIAKFGPSSAGWGRSYEFPSLQAEDEWEQTRPEVVQPAGGASGVFDYYGINNYPVAPLEIVKRFRIHAGTYAGVETAIDELRGATLAIGRGQLWGLRRDGSVRWCWAKCTGLSVLESYENPGLTIPVEARFYAPEGVWYGTGGGSQYITSLGPRTYTNIGNYPALAGITLNAATGTWTNFAARVVWGSATICQWSFDYPAGFVNLVVDPVTYRCTFRTSSAPGAPTYDGYRYLTIPNGQVAWLWLGAYVLGISGDNTVYFSASGSATFGSGSSHIWWADTYL